MAEGMKNKMEKQSPILKCGLSLFKILLWILFLLYVVFPLAVYVYPDLICKGLFFAAYACPYYSNFSDFESFDRSASSVRNFYLESIKNSTKLGVWHLLPDADRYPVDKLASIDPSEFEKKLANGKPIILYLHGNALNRGGKHMLSIYNVFTALNYHVISPDYRGYGDSEGSATCEDDVVSDAITAYFYIKKHAPKSPLFVWGHSLGSAITTGLCARLTTRYKKEVSPPLGIALESPFTNAISVAHNHPISLIHRYMPYFESVFIRALNQTHLQLDNLENIKNCNVPLVVFHSKDDHIIPYSMAQELFEAAKKLKLNLRLHLFAENKGYWHKHLYLAPDLPILIKKFVEDYIGKKK